MSIDLLIAIMPKMTDLGSHYVSYHSCLQDAFLHAGIPSKVVVPLFCKADHLPETWEKSFDPYAEINPYLHLFQPSLGKKRIYFLDSYDTQELIDFISAFQTAASIHDQAWFILRYDILDFDLHILLHSDLLRSLHMQFGSRIQFLTDTCLIQKDAEEKLGAPVKLLPIPHTFTPLHPPEKEPIICWWPGKPRPDKGLDVIQRILQISSPNNLLVRCGFTPEIDLASVRASINFLPNILTQEDYCKTMSSVHALLLPYQKERYAYSSSGIFIEGVVAGKMPFVTDGTWLSYELERFGLDALAIEWRDPDLWHRILELYRDHKLQMRLQEMQAEYRIYHSTQNYSRVIADLLI